MTGPRVPVQRKRAKKLSPIESAVIVGGMVLRGTAVNPVAIALLEEARRFRRPVDEVLAFWRNGTLRQRRYAAYMDRNHSEMRWVKQKRGEVSRSEGAQP